MPINKLYFCAIFCLVDASIRNIKVAICKQVALLCTRRIRGFDIPLSISVKRRLRYKKLTELSGENIVSGKYSCNHSNKKKIYTFFYARPF